MRGIPAKLLLFLFTVPISAESFSSVQLGSSAYIANYSSSAYDWSTDSSVDGLHSARIGAAGFNFTLFNGDTFGFLGTSNWQYLPLAGMLEGRTINTSQYDLRISNSGTLGLGYRFKSDFGDLVAGLGPHYSTVQLEAKHNPYLISDSTDLIDLGMNAGVGVIGLMRIPLLKRLYFAATVSIGYDFLPIIQTYTTRNVSVLEASISSGFGILF